MTAYFDKEVSITDARGNIGGITDEVFYSGIKVAITKNGTPVAVVVPIDLVEALQAIEDSIDLEDAKKAIKRIQKRGADNWDQVKKKMGL